MSNTGQPVVFYCPSCGASVAMQGERGTCAFCGTAMERPRSSPPPQAPRPADQVPVWTAPRVTVVRANLATPRRRGGCLSALMTLLILAGIAFGVGQAVTQGRLLTALSGVVSQGAQLPNVISRIKLGPITQLATVLPRDGKGGDLLVYAYGVGTSRYTIALIDGATQSPRWQSQPLSKEAYQGYLVAGRDMVYLTDQNQLLALRMSDGTPAWQVTLDVEPQNSCAECLRLLGDHVIVLEKNGGLQAFAAATGKPAWSARLADTPRRLPVAGNRIVTLQPSKEKDGTLISFLDPASGKATLQLDPHCTALNSFSEHERPNNSAPFFFSEDGKSLYTAYGFFSQCAQAFDLSSGALRWDSPIDDLSPSTWYNSSTLLTEKALFVSNNQLIWAIDTANGHTRTVVENKEYTMHPLALRDDTLIVLAAPTWDSQRQELWGLDAATGQRRWQQQLQAHSLQRDSSSGDWDWQLTRQGLVVVQVLRDEARLIVQAIDPRTGTSSYKQESELSGMHSPSLYRSLWADDTAWLKLDSSIYVIDLSTGKATQPL